MATNRQVAPQANYVIDVEVDGFEHAMRAHKREGFKVMSAWKEHTFFQTPRQRNRKKLARARRRPQIEACDPLTFAILTANLENPVDEFKKGRGAPVNNKEERTGVPLDDAALMIIRFTADPPLFPYIKDRQKQKFGFSFGGKDEPESRIFDADIYATARRESGEEIFFGLDDVQIPEINNSHCFVRIAVTATHTVYCFAFDMPAGTPTAPGKDQEFVRVATAEEIRRLVAENKFLSTHATAWKIYDQKFLRA